MELQENVTLKKIKQNNEITPEVLQELIQIVKKTCQKQSEEFYGEILEKLWFHLISDWKVFDDQLLCATCFYSVLSYSKNQEWYLNKTVHIINKTLSKEGMSDEKNDASQAVSLCYGVFQSTYLLSHTGKPFQEIEITLNAIFKLIVTMAYEYSQHTFMVFKIMSAFKKVIGTPYQEYLLNSSNKITLLNLVNHNWENPITGVRNLNRQLFQMLLLVFDQKICDEIINEINAFYWNKAKFLMLAEFIEYTNDNVEGLIIKNQWIPGLMYSLHNPGLVSAGADLYCAILKKLVSDIVWIKLYLTDVLNLLTAPSFKAIDNISNYWGLITFKKFPSLFLIILNELKNIDNSELKLYSCMSIMKQANKLGLLKKTWVAEYSQEEVMISESLEHCNPFIRMMAFEILCISQKKDLPSKIEFQLILDYLENNVNTDCTVLRLNTLNCLTNFFITLHTTFSNRFKHGNIEDMKNLVNFCINLQKFVIKSINYHGNYQRKITTVKIAHIILNHFNEIPKKKQKQVRDNVSLINFLKEKGYWLLNSNDYIDKIISLLKDPSADIHNCSLQLLLKFYLFEISDTTKLDYLIDEGLNCIRSKFFFEINCGLNILKLVINIIIRNKDVSAKFKSVEEILYFAYNEVMGGYEKIDVVESIAEGKQMHSFLSLIQVIFDVLIENSYKVTISPETILSLLKILKDISRQFAWEEESSTSSDFSKMNDKILDLIKSSSYNEVRNDETKICGLYQIVLNCLWLNVKATCELATILIQYFKDNIQVCEESLNIIAHVLETSRHKGAIEAAGAALGLGIRYLTYTDTQVSVLPTLLLERKLNELLVETTKMSSVTRRGAGLSIMVHRIVSNDMKKGKPLFHYFMKTILSTCSSKVGYDVQQNVNNEKDLPKAVYIHFLTRIVTDSSLASDMMYYSAELAELAFCNMIDPHWQIRNAALQLYGALIPKLIGQKKPSGTDDVIMSYVACDEFRTHSPKLWDSIILQLKNNTKQDLIQSHSNLVPLLNTLANIARRYNFSYNLNEKMESDLNLLPYLFVLLGSPIYTVRRLTSMCIINLYSFETIHSAIINVKIPTENNLHGILMVMENCYRIYSDTHKNQLNTLRNEFRAVLYKENHSYLYKWTLGKLFNEEVTVDKVKQILSIENSICYEPGAALYVKQNIQRCLETASWDIVPDVLSLILHTSDFETYCDILLQRIVTTVIPEKSLLNISKILISSDHKSKSSALWKTLYYISKQNHVNIEIPSSYLQGELGCNINYNLRYLVPFATKIFARNTDYVNLLLISKQIYLLCDPQTNDVEMRIIAATANNELSFKFNMFPDDVKINAIKSFVILLQDEDDEIRNLSVNFYTSLLNQINASHPFVCLNRVLNKDFLYELFNEPISSTQNICKDLLGYLKSINGCSGNDLNPFANDSKNIYLEINVLKELLMNLCTCIQ